MRFVHIAAMFFLILMTGCDNKNSKISVNPDDKSCPALNDAWRDYHRNVTALSDLKAFIVSHQKALEGSRQTQLASVAVALERNVYEAASRFANTYKKISAAELERLARNECIREIDRELFIAYLQ